MHAEWISAAWLVATVAAYYLLKPLYRRWPHWWTSPLLTVPSALLLAGTVAHLRYQVYIRDSHLLLTLLGPATVAFALPIWRYRTLIRRHWPALAAGVLTGTTLAIGSCWLLAHWLALSPELLRSLIPRSVTTPFAMRISAEIGGTPQLTAVFVVLTGIGGIALGEGLMRWLPLRSALARGALLGLGAHGAGVARAQAVGGEEGAVASLAMVLVGLFNVLLAPLLALLLH